jgi:hypothetical protein
LHNIMVVVLLFFINDSYPFCKILVTKQFLASLIMNG